MKATICIAACALAFGSVSARTVDGDNTEQAPVTIGAYTFDALGRMAGVTLPDGRTIQYLYDGNTNKIIAVRRSGGVWDLPPPMLAACQLNDPSAMSYCLTRNVATKRGTGASPQLMIVEELPPVTVVGSPGDGGNTGSNPGGGGGTGGVNGGENSGGGGDGWTGANCQNNCDIAYAWAATYCAGVGLVDPPLGFACLVAETAAYTYCSYRCRFP